MLLQYLLLSSPEEISETFFFFSGKHFGEIRKKIKNHKYFIFHDLPRAVRCFLWLPYWGYFILTKELHWNFIKKSNLFINDHLPWGCILGQRYKYNLLEDGVALYMNPLPKGYWGKIRAWLLNPFPRGSWGMNDNCSTIHMTQSVSIDSPLNKKKITVNSFKKLWNESSEEKRKIIIDIFDITAEDINCINKCENLILTQPFSEMNYMKTDEEISCLKKMIQTLELENIMIKTHPAEKKNYKKIFPQIDVYTKKTPMELFALLGCNFKKVITVSSTAAMIFKDNAEIIWYGEKFSEQLNMNLNVSIPEAIKQILSVDK